MSRDGYVSLLDEEGHLRSDLEVSNDDTVKTLKDKMDKMNADTETDVMVCLGLNGVPLKSVISKIWIKNQKLVEYKGKIQ